MVLCSMAVRCYPLLVFYDVLLDRLNPFILDDKKHARYVSSARFVEDSSPARLTVRETCAMANYKRKESKL